VGQLLDQNQRILLQFKDNMRLYKVRGVSRAWQLPTYLAHPCEHYLSTAAARLQLHVSVTMS